MCTIRKFIHPFVLVVTIAAICIDRSPCSAADVAEEEGRLIGLLRSEAAPQDKALACKRLAVVGSKNAVPALAPLLENKELASWARIALEAIPDPAADQALRDSLGKVQGRLLIGVVNSIGVRRDVQAVDGLAERVKDADVEVASSAAVALGRIGNEAAAEILVESLTSPNESVRSAVAEGCILCAEQLQAAGKDDEAAALFDKVRQADVPRQRIQEATRGAILAREAAGIPLLVEQLRSTDKGLLAMGLTTSRELLGPKVTQAIGAEVAQTTADRQVLLIQALADRRDEMVLPAVLQAASSGPDNVRIVALQALKRVGNATCVPTLLDVLSQSQPELAQAAKEALEGISGQDVDDMLVARLAESTGKLRHALIELAGQRRITAATPALLKAANDTDPHTRAAALTALGETVGPNDLAGLISRVVSPKNATDAESQAAKLALRAACIRMPDGEACAEQLSTAIAHAPPSAKCVVVEILGAMGGKKALSTIAAAAKESDSELQDVASRVLGEWMTADAAPVLLDLAGTAPEARHQVRALRGFIRIARQFVLPDQQRTEMCRSALRVAKRDAEKLLVLEVLERYPSLDTLKLAVDAAKTPAIKTAATNACLVIAQKIGRSDDVRRLLAQVGYTPVKVEIIKAEYGAAPRYKDVTEILRRNVSDLAVVVLPESSYNSSFGGDPAPGAQKELKVRYKINDQAAEIALPENATILLPMPKKSS
jgi:HEAT repeat protein